MKTEKSIQFLSNNRKLIAGPCKKQFFLSFHLFYYIHTPVPPLSQANQSDGNRVAREVGFDHHLTTSSPQPVPLIVCTLQHSFITTTNNAESCAHYTISGAVSWHLPARHSSPTRKAAGSNPVSRTKKCRCIAVQRHFCFVMVLLVDPLCDKVRYDMGHDRYSKTDKIVHKGSPFCADFCQMLTQGLFCQFFILL